MTKKISGDGTQAKKLQCCQVQWDNKDGRWEMSEVENSDFELKADLVLLSMGFVHVEHGPLIQGLDVKLDDRGNIITRNWQTDDPKVFASGDATSGASLVVRAIDAGRKMATAVDRYLRQ
jgi:NADPH-dependent glutamate synthase beta subunit-like oxidoreductase